MADAKQMLIAGLDQQHEQAVQMYDDLEPIRRRIVSDWLCGKHGPLNYAPPWVLDIVVVLATTGFMEAGNRWALRKEEHEDQI